MDSREKDNMGNRRLTVHVRPKPAHLIALLGHLGLLASQVNPRAELLYGPEQIIPLLP